MNGPFHFQTSVTKKNSRGERSCEIDTGLPFGWIFFFFPARFFFSNVLYHFPPSEKCRLFLLQTILNQLSDFLYIKPSVGFFFLVWSVLFCCCAGLLLVVRDE